MPPDGHQEPELGRQTCTETLDVVQVAPHWYLRGNGRLMGLSDSPNNGTVINRPRADARSCSAAVRPVLIQDDRSFEFRNQNAVAYRRSCETATSRTTEDDGQRSAF